MAPSAQGAAIIDIIECSLERLSTSVMWRCSWHAVPVVCVCVCVCVYMCVCDWY